MKWYYTKQKLPEKEGLYLCYTEDGFYVLCKFSNNLYNIDGFDLCDGDKRGFYRGNSTVGFRRYNAIKYWTCLPEPPVPRDEKGIQKLNKEKEYCGEYFDEDWCR